MKGITYTVGDATAPAGDGNKIVCHICNDIGGWGRGFVLAISKRWPEPEQEYRKWFENRGQDDFVLGAVQFVQVEPAVSVANMIGQRDIREKNGVPPIRYEAVETALMKVAEEAQKMRASVHMPRIGCGLAGGKWEEMEPIIERALVAKDIKVFVYDLG
jgi:O-acetyl-ADP-ribose deacetylase (regulator of RNase III)